MPKLYKQQVPLHQDKSESKRTATRTEGQQSRKHTRRKPNINGKQLKAT
jgi:hypothetical protein